MESTHNISSSKKLPSILMLNNNSYYDYNHVVVSPPLTPAVSPSTTMTIDSNNNLYNNNNYAYSTYNNNSINNKNSNINSPISNHDNNQTTTHKHICHFNFCGWSFKRYEHLKRHMLVHTGERPHTCRYPGCGKSFSRSDNFHAHYRTHTKKKNCTTLSKKKNAAVTTVSAAVTGSVTNDSNNGFSLLSNQNDQKFMTFNSIASSVATNAAVVAVSQQQLQPNQQVFYNSHLYDGNSPEINSYYNRNTFHSSNTSPSIMNFNLQQQPNHMMSPTSSPSTPPRTLSLLNHESTQPNPFFSSIYAPNYMSSYPIYQQPEQSILSMQSNKSTLTNKSTTKSSPITKSHACPVSQCMRRFKRLEHLKRHMRIHTLEKPFRCSYPACQKNFSRSDNLSQHIKTHQRHDTKHPKL